MLLLIELNCHCPWWGWSLCPMVEICQVNMRAGRGGGGAASACLHWGQISNKKPVIVIASQQPPAAACTSITLSNKHNSFLPSIHYCISSYLHMLGVGGSVIWYFIIWPNRMELYYSTYCMEPWHLHNFRSPVYSAGYGGGWCSVWSISGYDLHWYCELMQAVISSCRPLMHRPARRLLPADTLIPMTVIVPPVLLITAAHLIDLNIYWVLVMEPCKYYVDT